VQVVYLLAGSLEGLSFLINLFYRVVLHHYRIAFVSIIMGAVVILEAAFAMSYLQVATLVFKVVLVPLLERNDQLLLYAIDVVSQVSDIDFHVFHFIVLSSVAFLYVLHLSKEAKFFFINNLTLIITTVSKFISNLKLFLFSFPVKSFFDSIDLFLVSVDSLSNEFDLCFFLTDFFPALNDSILKFFSFLLLKLSKGSLFAHNSLLLLLVLLFNHPLLQPALFNQLLSLLLLSLLLLLLRRHLPSLGPAPLGLSLPLRSLNILLEPPVLVLDDIHVLPDLVQRLQIAELLQLASQVLLHVLVHLFQFVRLVVAVLNATSVGQGVVHR
jgi:hypothetical protein